MESMFSGDELLPSEKYFENGIFCHKFSISLKCQKALQSPKIWKGAEDFLLSYFKFG